MLQEGVWLELVILGALIWLGYIGARLASRFNLPSVTGFLLVGVVLGPYGLGLLSLDLLHKIEFVNPLALGLIVFLIGEELTAKMLARHHWSFWLIATLSVALPAVFVLFGSGWVDPDERIAWVLAAIAMSGAPATLMSVLAETRAKGRSCDMLLGSAAFSDIATVVAYAIVVPVLLVRSGAIDSVYSAGMSALIEIVGGVVLGVLVGLILSRLIARASDDGELLALGLTHVLVTVALARILGVSTLLAPLVLGITVAVAEERRGDRSRCFNALRTVEYPVYIIFFTLAGAELDISILLQGGLLLLVYIVGRSAGKFLAGFVGSLAGGLKAGQAAWFGFGSLPQAGVAVGLALSAAVDFPEVGQTLTAVVLAAIVVFELFGPVAAKNASLRLGCAPDSCEIDEEALVCRERVVLVPVSHHWSADKLLHALAATDDETECPSTFILATVVVPGRYTPGEAAARAQRVLDDLASVAREEGYLVDTRISTSRTIEGAIATMADELAADLVVLGTPATGTRRRVGGLVRSPLHKIIDRLSTPVFVIPEGWEPREIGAHVSATVHADDGAPAGATDPGVETSLPESRDASDDV